MKILKLIEKKKKHISIENKANHMLLKIYDLPKIMSVFHTKLNNSKT
jgi:hypothetical protein